MSTIVLDGDYGYSPYKISGLSDGTVIDAENATFIHDNNDNDGKSNPYPVMVYDAKGVVLDGGTIVGNIDQNSAWRDVYDLGNAAAIRTEDTPDVVIRDWRISKTWDAIRVSWNSDNFLIEDVWVTDARDDAVENDRLLTGTIKDSLFDGVYAGLSIDPSSSSPVDGSGETVTLDGVLLRLQKSLYKGEMTHGSFIKTDSATDGEVTPNLRFIDCVFALEDVEHRSYRSMLDAWDHTVESSGNVFLNLSDTPLPDDYPMPPKGWEVLQGQAARDYWEQARAEWIENHEDEDGNPRPDDSDDPVPEVDDEPDPDVGKNPPQTPEEEPEPEVDDEPDPDVGKNPPETPEDNPEPEIDEETDPDVGKNPPETPEDNPEPTDDARPTFEGRRFEGDDSDETIIGNSKNNIIDGDNGDDFIRGGAGQDNIRGDDGRDILWGDEGADMFFFKRLSDSREKTGVDTIMDFETGDRINVSRIDADRGMSGNQAFELVAGSVAKAGELAYAYDSETGTTVVTGNVDSDSEAEFMLMIVGNVALTDSDFLL